MRLFIDTKGFKSDAILILNIGKKTLKMPYGIDIIMWAQEYPAETTKFVFKQQIFLVAVAC